MAMRARVKEFSDVLWPKYLMQTIHYFIGLKVKTAQTEELAIKLQAIDP